MKSVSVSSCYNKHYKAQRYIEKRIWHFFKKVQKAFFFCKFVCIRVCVGLTQMLFPVERVWQVPLARKWRVVMPSVNHQLLLSTKKLFILAFKSYVLKRSQFSAKTNVYHICQNLWLNFLGISRFILIYYAILFHWKEMDNLMESVTENK